MPKTVEDQQDANSLHQELRMWRTTLEANLKPAAQVTIKCGIYQCDAALLQWPKPPQLDH